MRKTLKIIILIYILSYCTKTDERLLLETNNPKSTYDEISLARTDTWQDAYAALYIKCMKN